MICITFLKILYKFKSIPIGVFNNFNVSNIMFILEEFVEIKHNILKTINI